MRGCNRPKQANSHPQRRYRFHHPHHPRPQRRRRFHSRPKNTTGGTITTPHTARHETRDTNARRLTLTFETHDTNARRLTLALETRDTNARLQPPKTGQFTPAKAIPVSPPAPPTPAKATPVSPPTPTTPTKAMPVSQPPKAHSPHDHEAPDSHHRDLSTGLILNARYPQGHDSSFSSHSSRAIIHPSDPYP